MNKAFLTKLRQKIPFLKRVPDEIYFNLDSSEFLMPNEKILKMREELEDELGHYVMIYTLKCSKDHKSIHSNQLCANLQTANLTSPQLKLLKSAELKAAKHGASLCIYDRELKQLSVNCHNDNLTS